MPLQIPQNRRWKAVQSDIFGSIANAYNIHFDEVGYLTLSPKSVSIFSQNDEALFGRLIAVLKFNNLYFIQTSTGSFELDSNLAVTAVSGDPTPVTRSDAVVWRDRVYVTTNSTSNISYYDGNSWATVNITTSGNTKPMAVFENKNALAVASGNVVRLMNSSDTVTDTLTIPADYEIQSLRWRQNKLYIGTKASQGREAKMFIWNGSGSEAQQAFGVGSDWIFSMAEYQSSMCVLTNAGQLLRFNGGGFDTLANFPVYSTQFQWIDGFSVQGRVADRGMDTDGDRLYINANGVVTKKDERGNIAKFFLPEQPSGVWCYDPQVGLYCRNLSTIDGISEVSVSSLSSNTLTLASAHRLETGEPVWVTAIGSLTGLTANITYYAIKVSSTEIKLAYTPADAKDGTAITLGGSAGVATVKIIDYDNFGQQWVANQPTGALAVVYEVNTSTAVFPEMVQTKYLWGFFDDDTSKNHLCSQSIARNVGVFSTVRLWSNQVADNFNKLIVKYDNINQDTDKITVRSRSKTRFGLPTRLVEGTYSNQTTIGSSSGQLGQVEDEDTIYILNGNGAGTSAEVQRDGDEYEMDQTVASASSSDAVEIYFSDYKKAGTITEQDENFKVITLTNKSPWVQSELEMRGNGVKVEMLQLVNNTNQELK